MAKSILQKQKMCYFCNDQRNLEEHHVFFGTANRKKSEHHGLKVWLCPEHHRGKTGVHHNKHLDKMVKRFAQKTFEKTHTREEFMREFGKNYLEE